MMNEFEHIEKELSVDNYQEYIRRINKTFK